MSISIENMRTKAMTVDEVGVLVGVLNDQPVLIRATPKNADPIKVRVASLIAARVLGYAEDRRFKTGWRKVQP
jgi:hypothetical protein